MESTASTEIDHAPVDSGLRCPKCEYNLTGVAENRCPECGETFDPEQLRALLDGAPAPIPIWDDEKQALVVRLCRICLLTWFAPKRLARMFPRFYSARSAQRFRLWTLLTCGLFWVVFLADARPREWVGILAGAAAFLIGVIVCEAVIAGCFNAEFRPDRGSSDSDATESLAGLVGMFRSFLILDTAAFALPKLATVVGIRLPYFHAGPALLLLAVWWWFAVAAVVTVLPGSFGQKIIPRLAIPFSAVVGLLAGGISFWVFLLIFGWIRF